jgi:hypothetical protein
MSDKNIRRIVYGKLGFDERDPTFFCDFYRELCRASGKRFTGLAKEVGDMCVEKLLAGDSKFFNAVAKTLKHWPPDIAKTQQFAASPVRASAWRFFNKGKGAKPRKYRREVFIHPISGQPIPRKELKPGEFTRHDLSNWICRETGVCPSPSQLTELLDFFGRKAKKKKPPGRPCRR